MGLIRVSITGPESSGKSALTESLADIFSAPFAREFARQYLQNTGGEYAFQDLDAIAAGQIALEDEALSTAKDIVFFDTDMLSIKIWSEYRFGRISKFLKEAFMSRVYTYTLLCQPDIPWEPDPLRESPQQSERDAIFEIFKNELDTRNQPYGIVSGDGIARLNKAESLIRRMFSL